MKSIQNSWNIYFNYLSFSMFYFLIILVIYYQFLYKTNFHVYWVAIPLFLYFISVYIEKTIMKKESSVSFFSSVCLISLILAFISLKGEKARVLIFQYFDTISFIIIIIFLLNIIISKKSTKDDFKEIKEPDKELFNLFYINTSKVHEIAMLIDNKIMKTIEKEQSSEELLKAENTLSLGSIDNLKANLGYSKSQNNKKRVYENFDVKMTKSIMLQKIYANIKKNRKSVKKLKSGDLFIFENIELEPRNIEDTVMMLDILQDSKIKNDPNEEVEINFNKMMDRMLDDFTIDYTFTYGNQKEKKYLLQILYKDTESFENGYQHNDLQLGKLNLIGIYRGEINFSEKESTSSKFLELMSKSYENEIKQTSSNKMKRSDTSNEQISSPIEFNHKKLKDSFHLVDVIAVIQDLNIR